MRACWPEIRPSSRTAALAPTGTPSARRPTKRSSPVICRRVRAGRAGASALPTTSSTARSFCSPGESGDWTAVSVCSAGSRILERLAPGPFFGRERSIAGDARQLGGADGEGDAVAQLSAGVGAPAADDVVGAGCAAVQRPGAHRPIGAGDPGGRRTIDGGAVAELTAVVGAPAPDAGVAEVRAAVRAAGRDAGGGGGEG